MIANCVRAPRRSHILLLCTVVVVVVGFGSALRAEILSAEQTPTETAFDDACGSQPRDYHGIRPAFYLNRSEPRLMSETIRGQIGPFAIVPLWLLQACDDAHAIRLYAYLSARWGSREGGSIHPKVSTLALDLKSSERAIHRALDGLRDVGAIQTTKRRRLDGSVAGLDFVIIQADPKLTATGGSKALQSATGGSKVTTGSGPAASDDHQTDTGVNRKLPPVAEQEHRSIEELDPNTKINTDVESKAMTMPEQIATCVDIYNACWEHRYKTPCSMIQSPMTLDKFRVHLERVTFPVMLDAIRAYLRSEDDFAMRAKHALGIFLSNPTKYLAVEQRPRAATNDSARRDIRATNIEHVTEASPSSGICIPGMNDGTD